MIAATLMGAALLMALVWMIDDAWHLYRAHARAARHAPPRR